MSIRLTNPLGSVDDHSTDTSHMNAKLWDFDVEGTTLKPKHHKWLDTAARIVNTISSRYRSFVWYISVTGEASLTGINAEPYNRLNSRLAGARAGAVEEYLKSKISGIAVFNPPFNAATMFAEFAKHRLGVENDEDRCVFVTITTDSSPPPVPRTPAPIPLSKEWAIRWVSGISGGEVIGIDSVRFDIADTKNHLHAYYDYRQDAFGVSLVAVAVTLGGSWTRFPTDTEIHISDFDGPCRYSTASAASLSVNYLTITPKGGATTIPATLKIDTGVTFNVSLSAGIPRTGWMNLYSVRPIPYAGAFPP